MYERKKERKKERKREREREKGKWCLPFPGIHPAKFVRL